MRDVNNTIRDKAYVDYCAGMKYKAIAEKYEVSVSAVKSWATRYWKVATTEKKLQPKPKQVATKKSIKKKLLISVDANEELTEKRRLFCVYYATSHNALQSYLKAYGGNKEVAKVEGCKLLTNPNVKAEVKRLRAIIRSDMDIGVSDLVQYCLKVVGADIGDYIEFGRRKEPVMGMYGPVMNKKTQKPVMEIVNYIDIKDSKMVDTSVLAEVKQGRDGIGIKLADKKWAWEILAKYLGFDDGAGEDGVQIVDNMEEDHETS